MDPQRWLELQLEAMSWQEFEHLIFAMVLTKYDNAEEMATPDGGVDTLVPATAEHGKRIYQAKHYPDDINWSACEESLRRAVAVHPDVECVTFVFPRNLSEPLRARFETDIAGMTLDPPRDVEIRKRTLGHLRTKLDEHRDLRRKYVGPELGDVPPQLMGLLGRLRAQRTRFDANLQATLRGPLQHTGQLQADTEARRLADEGEFATAGEKLVEIAVALRDNGFASIANVYLEQAANLLREGGDRGRAVELRLQVAADGARRGEVVAEIAAGRATWEAPPEQQLWAHASLARCSWPERGPEVLEPLRDVVGVAREEGRSDLIEWAAALMHADGTLGDWLAVTATAEGVSAHVDPAPTAAGDRLDFELDRLEACFRAGADIEADMRRLLALPIGRLPEAAGQIHARWGVLRARAERIEEAREQFRHARDRWGEVEGSEDEVGEAVFSEQAALQLLGTGHDLPAPDRFAAAALRGAAESEAVLADRREAEGLRYFMQENFYEARRHLTFSYGVHRRLGHFQGMARLATALTRLFHRCEEPAEALRWAIQCADTKVAAAAAEKLPWSATKQLLALSGAWWERAASFAGLRAVGGGVPEADAAALADVVLGEAANEITSPVSPQPSLEARRALATLTLSLRGEQLERALEILRHEARSGIYPPDEVAQALGLVHDTGLSDESEVLAELFCGPFGDHLPTGRAGAVVAVSANDRARAFVRDQAAAGNEHALRFAAEAGIAQADETLSAIAAERVNEALEDPTDHGLRADWLGWLAGCAPADIQRRAAKFLIAAANDTADFETNRADAMRGLTTLARRLDADDARALLEATLAIATGPEQRSEREGFRSHRNAHFARYRLTASAAGAVRGNALAAAGQLAARGDQLEAIVAPVSSALYDEERELVTGALWLVAQYPSLAGDADVSELVNSPDREVRGLAVGALAAADPTTLEAQAILRLTSDPELFVRSSLLVAAREHRDHGDAILEALSHDGHAYIRACVAGVREGRARPAD